MSKEQFFESDFISQISAEKVIEITQVLKERSFYAPLVVDTFFDLADQNTLIANCDTRYNFWSIGANMQKFPQALVRLWWSTYSKEQALKLDINDSFSNDIEKLRDNLIYGEGLRNRLTIQSDGHAEGMFTAFKKEGEWEKELISNLTMSFYPSTIGLAPGKLQNKLDYWLLTQFVPDFLENKVAPVANVPRREMTSSVIIKKPD